MGRRKSANRTGEGERRRKRRRKEPERKLGKFGMLLKLLVHCTRCDGFPQRAGRVAVRYFAGPEQLEAVGSDGLLLGAKAGPHVSLSW